MTLKHGYDAANDVLTIEGIRYSGELFRTLAFGDIGSTLKLANREDGVVTLLSERVTT